MRNAQAELELRPRDHGKVQRVSERILGVEGYLYARRPASVTAMTKSRVQAVWSVKENRQVLCSISVGLWKPVHVRGEARPALIPICDAALEGQTVGVAASDGIGFVKVPAPRNNAMHSYIERRTERGKEATYI